MSRPTTSSLLRRDGDLVVDLPHARSRRGRPLRHPPLRQGVNVPVEMHRATADRHADRAHVEVSHPSDRLVQGGGRPPWTRDRTPMEPLAQGRNRSRPRGGVTRRGRRVSAGVEEPGRSTLKALRRTILEIVPDAEQVISYRVPAFRVRGEPVAGFAAFKNHLSYLPFSGSVLSQLADELDGYAMTKSSLHFPVDRPLPKALVRT